MMIREKKRLTVAEAVPKIKHYCGYQERSHGEVRDKLYSFGLAGREVDAVLSQMIEENYLNEERYAMLFSGGKFRMKKWGRVKIRHALKQRNVSEYCIRKALKHITDDEYMETLNMVSAEKIAGLKGEKNIFRKKKKLLDYLLQKGYERELVMEIVNQL